MDNPEWIRISDTQFVNLVHARSFRVDKFTDTVDIFMGEGRLGYTVQQWYWKQNKDGSVSFGNFKEQTNVTVSSKAKG